MHPALPNRLRRTHLCLHPRILVRTLDPLKPSYIFLLTYAHGPLSRSLPCLVICGSLPVTGRAEEGLRSLTLQTPHFTAIFVRHTLQKATAASPNTAQADAKPARNQQRQSAWFGHNREQQSCQHKMVSTVTRNVCCRLNSGNRQRVARLRVADAKEVHVNSKASVARGRDQAGIRAARTSQAEAL